MINMVIISSFSQSCSPSGVNILISLRDRQVLLNPLGCHQFASVLTKLSHKSSGCHVYVCVLLVTSWTYLQKVCSTIKNTNYSWWYYNLFHLFEPVKQQSCHWVIFSPFNVMGSVTSIQQYAVYLTEYHFLSTHTVPTQMFNLMKYNWNQGQ